MTNRISGWLALADELERVFSRTRTTHHIAVDAGLVQDILTALRSIAAPKQDAEPAAWMYHKPGGTPYTSHMPPEEVKWQFGVTPLYAHPNAPPAVSDEALVERIADVVENLGYEVADSYDIARAILPIIRECLK